MICYRRRPVTISPSVQNIIIIAIFLPGQRYITRGAYTGVTLLTPAISNCGLSVRFIENKHPDLTIHPNPAATAMVVSLSREFQKDDLILVYSVDGKLISRILVGHSIGQQKIDISQWPNGMYAVTILRKEEVISAKVIVAH